jgi:hypothetical protein
MAVLIILAIGLSSFACLRIAAANTVASASKNRME